jgi:hypothetical protein
MGNEELKGRQDWADGSAIPGAIRDLITVLSGLGEIEYSSPSAAPMERTCLANKNIWDHDIENSGESPAQCQME